MAEKEKERDRECKREAERYRKRERDPASFDCLRSCNNCTNVNRIAAALGSALLSEREREGAGGGGTGDGSV